MSDDIQPGAEPIPRSVPGDTWRTLRCGLRGALFAGPGAAGVPVAWTQLAVVIGLSLALPFLEQLFEVGWQGSLATSGLPYLLFTVPLVLLAGWSLAVLGRRPGETLSLVIVIMAASVWIGAVAWILATASGRLPHGRTAAWFEWGLYYLPPLWLALCAVVAATRMLRLSWPRRGAAVAIAFVFIAYPLATIWMDRTIWAKPYDERTAEERSSYDAIAHEDVFYLQPKLLERDLAALLPGRAGHPEFYLVSVAGYADQDVFLREVNSVDALFAERYGTRGRSLKLVNNRKTVREIPIATQTALALSLKRVGALMNRDEDVLVLFLTSHGSRDQRLSLEFRPLRLNDLAPADLRQMLDDAGIKFRVLIVSACYSGGFADALAGENTLVITASARDRNSFGCSNDADFTYFGKAYFDEALRQTDSFIEAFAAAAPRIAARETKEGYDASNPQMVVGANITARLETVQRAAMAQRASETDAAGAAGSRANDSAPADAGVR